MIHFSFETITPETARRVLEEHDEAVANGEIINRHRKASAVRRIAADILADQWFPQTGETIKFEKNGGQWLGKYLVDGQTRLAACQQANRPIDVWVASDVERNAFVYIDSGEKRTLKDVLQIAGEPEARTLAATLSWIYRWDFSNDTLTGRGTVSHAQAKKILEADPAIRKSAIAVRGVRLLGAGVAAFLHRIFSKKDPALADLFVDAIITGQNLRAGEPFYVLRERLIANKGSRRSKIGARELINMSIKAWNATREGKTLKIIKIGKGEDQPVLL